VDMKLVLAGASGFLGTALAEHLRDQGHEVVRLVRSDPSGPDQLRWDPAAGELDPAYLEGADTVFNLGGVPIAHWPWTRSYREQIVTSRLEATGTLAETIAGLHAKPALVSASGANVYGFDRGDERIDESSDTGTGFLADVCRSWEHATSPAADAGGRVAIMRSAPVLHRSGGMLKLAKLPFGLGIGGRLGGGQQWFPSISLRDYLGAATRLATDAELSGVFNLVAPVPATNADFTEAMGRRLKRPTVIPVPAFALKVATGEQSGMLLGSLHITPERLLAVGFAFADPTVQDAVDFAFTS
jgi:uncharacterized protein (TIGR01777 family)